MYAHKYTHNMQTQADKALWGIYRITKKEDEGKNPAVVQPVGYTGTGLDSAQCTFCRIKTKALIDRLRNHIAGLGVGLDPANIKACPGVTKNAEESVEAFAAREKQFAAARQRCVELNEEKAEKKRKKGEQDALDRLTGPASFLAGGAKPRPSKQTRLDDLDANASLSFWTARGA